MPDRQWPMTKIGSSGNSVRWIFRPMTAVWSSQRAELMTLNPLISPAMATRRGEKSNRFRRSNGNHPPTPMPSQNRGIQKRSLYPET